VQCVYGTPCKRPEAPSSESLRQTTSSFLRQRSQSSQEDYRGSGFPPELLSASGGEETVDPPFPDTPGLTTSLSVDQETGTYQYIPPMPPDLSSVFMDAGLFGNLEDSNIHSNLDWIFDSNLNDFSQVELRSPNFNRLFSGPSMDPAHVFQDQPTLIPLKDTDWAKNGSGEVTSIPSLPIPVPHNQCGPDDPWPMEWHATQGQALELPVLGGQQEGSGSTPIFYPTTPVSPSARMALQDILRAPLMQSPWPILNTPSFPSEEKLNHCIDMYFMHFDRVCDQLHVRLRL
jgi:hypothetical protein